MKKLLLPLFLVAAVAALPVYAECEHCHKDKKETKKVHNKRTGKEESTHDATSTKKDESGVPSTETR